LGEAKPDTEETHPPEHWTEKCPLQLPVEMSRSNEAIPGSQPTL